MLITVRDQAAGLAQTEFQQISSGIRGTGPEAGQPEEERRTGSVPTSRTESMEIMNAAARALEGMTAVRVQQVNETVGAVTEQQTSEAVDATELQAVEEQHANETAGAATDVNETVDAVEEQQASEAIDAAELQAVKEQTRFETEVEQVIAQAESIMEQRSVDRWEKSLKEAVKVRTAKDQTDAEHALLSLGIPERHWRRLEVREKLDRGEWVIFNVNVLGTHQHFVLLKPMKKTMTGKNGHVVLHAEANGLCAFTAALQIAKSTGALVLESDSNEPGDKRTRAEFKALKKEKCIEEGRRFAALMQVEALHEQITAHMLREERAARERASLLGREADRRSNWLEGSSRVLQQRLQAVSAPRDEMSADTRSEYTSKEIQESLKAETEFHIQTFRCMHQGGLQDGGGLLRHMDSSVGCRLPGDSAHVRGVTSTTRVERSVRPVPRDSF